MRDKASAKRVALAELRQMVLVAWRESCYASGGFRKGCRGGC